MDPITAAVLGWGALAGTGASTNWFGLGGKKKKEGEEGLQTISTLTPQQQAIMAQLGGYISENIGKGLPAWPGAWTVPETEGELWGAGKYKEAVEGLSPEEVSRRYMKYTAPSEARYMRDVTIPGIKESKVPGGTLRGRGTEQDIGRAWETFREGQLGRIGQDITTSRAEAIGALPGYMGAAALPRLIEQQDLASQIQEFIRTTPQMNPVLNLAMQYLGEGTMASYFPAQQQSPFMQLISAVAPAVGMGMGSYYGAGGGGGASTNQNWLASPEYLSAMNVGY